ncbi:MAG: ABC transporter permease [Alcaligenaceae bacterium]|nr:ABC transporter permease [Alcaligenaceae bacterium]HZJ96857.1 ABC transporter permease [Oligella sp.]
MRQILSISMKEVRDGLRNRWVVATTLLLVIFALVLGMLGSAPTGTVKVDPLTVTLVSLSSLSIFLIPLIALLLSYDAIVGEVERGTMSLLLSYPVARWQVLAGKFLGHVIILAIATVVGYGVAGVVLHFLYGGSSTAAWIDFGKMIGLSVFLGASFLSIGYLLSTLVRERATAAGLALFVWLFMVVIFDMALIGILVADSKQLITADMLNYVLLFNPADIYRLLNLVGSENISLFAGMAGLSDQMNLQLSVLYSALALWVVVPFILAVMVFNRKQL